MRTETVSFFSEGERMAGLWRSPDSPAGLLPTVVQGPGWLGLKDAGLYVRYHEALTAAGFGVFIFDYRGFGDSEGRRGVLSLRSQVEDLSNAVSYVRARDDVDSERIGAFGSGGTGGGNVILLAATDPRVKAIVSQLPVADGADWLHRMRSENEWLDFLEMLEQDRKDRAQTGKGRLVHPREEIMVPTPERKATKVKADVDDRIPTAISLSAADDILTYRPLDVVGNIKVPLMVIGVENDATTPTDHATRLYEAAPAPKALLMQRHTSHYAAYDQYWETVTPRLVSWFEEHLRDANVLIRETPGEPLNEVIESQG